MSVIAKKKKKWNTDWPGSLVFTNCGQMSVEVIVIVALCDVCLQVYWYLLTDKELDTVPPLSLASSVFPVATHGIAMKNPPAAQKAFSP